MSGRNMCTDPFEDQIHFFSRICLPILVFSPMRKHHVTCLTLNICIYFVSNPWVVGTPSCSRFLEFKSLQTLKTVPCCLGTSGSLGSHLNAAGVLLECRKLHFERQGQCSCPPDFTISTAESHLTGPRHWAWPWKPWDHGLSQNQESDD